MLVTMALLGWGAGRQYGGRGLVVEESWAI